MKLPDGTFTNRYYGYTSMTDEEVDNYFDEIDNEKQKLITKFLNYKRLTK